MVKGGSRGGTTGSLPPKTIKGGAKLCFAPQDVSEKKFFFKVYLGPSQKVVG